MKNIDTEKLSKEINDALMHRACVMRSGKYLSKYLIHCNRSVDAIRLLARCSIHDISKIQNTEEFLSLASIIDQIDSMHNVEHVLSTSQQEAIRLHWKNNSHHPEHYESSNDMSELDIMEMACDCHARSKQYGTNLIDYIDAQQRLRFHFDPRHLYMLKRYCLVLVEATKNDDYSAVLNDDYNIEFNFKDSTMRQLEEFDDSAYISSIKTERLYLNKVETADFASVAYSIYTQEDNTKVGSISLKFNGNIEYKIYENYRGVNYLEEALSKFIEIARLNSLFVNIRREDTTIIDIFSRIGFVESEGTVEQITLRYKRDEKELKKVPK